MEDRNSEYSSDSEYWSECDDVQDSLGQLREGAIYRRASDAVHAVQDFVLKQGKAVRVETHGGTDRKVVCTSANCGFFVRIYRRSKTVQGKRKWLDWYISSAILTHNECVSTAKPTQRQIASLASFAAALRANTSSSANALIEQVRETEGISLTKMKRTVYRAMDKVREQSVEEVERSYGQIASYLENFARENPGTIAVAEKDSMSRFKRAAVVVGAFVQASGTCQKIAGIDCSHSKSRHYSGVQVHLVGRDGNLENVTLAFGLIPAEDSESYLRVLNKVAEAGLDLSRIPVFSDRGAALLAVEADAKLHLRFCTLHIIRNIIHKFGKLSQEDKNLVWAIQAADTREAYESKLAVVCIALGPAVRDYIKNIDPIKWCLHANIGK